jgi:hypothetical protein
MKQPAHAGKPIRNAHGAGRGVSRAPKNAANNPTLRQKADMMQDECDRRR